MISISDARRAVRLADELHTLREGAKVLREDRSLVVTIKIEDLTRTYGSDRHRVTFTYAKARLLDVIAAEEARVIVAIAELGVDDKEEPR